jgi:hypothetical protein
VVALVVAVLDLMEEAVPFLDLDLDIQVEMQQV